MPFINNTRKFVFIGNARCASTSMYEELENIFKDDDTVWEDGRDAKPYLYHMGIEDTIATYPFCKDYKKFCFVRNPWSRMLSSYIEFSGRKEFASRSGLSLHTKYIADLKEQLAIADLHLHDAIAYDSDNIIDTIDDLVFKIDKTRSKAKTLLDDYQIACHHEWNENICEYNNFQDFCKDFPNNSLRHDIHFLPMYNQMSIDGEMVMDYVGRFENMTEDFADIMYKLTGEAFSLKRHVRKTESKNNYSYRETYDDETKKIIENYYQKDIEYFNYRF